MEPRRPRLHRQQCLRVLTATAAALVVEVDGVPYYVTCWPRRDNPPAAGPLRPAQWVRVYNTPAPGGATLVERLTPDGAGDGCTYLLRDYDRVGTKGPAAPRPEPDARASRVPRHRREIPEDEPAPVRGPAPAALDQEAPARRDLAHDAHAPRAPRRREGVRRPARQAEPPGPRVDDDHRRGGRRVAPVPHREDRPRVPGTRAHESVSKRPGPPGARTRHHRPGRRPRGGA